MAESVFGKPVDNGVKENASAIAALNSNMTIGNIYSDSAQNDLNTYRGYNGARMFYVGAGVTNSPQNYSTLLVISRSGDGLATQLSIGESVYSRVFIGSPPAWSAWKKLN